MNTLSEKIVFSNKGELMSEKEGLLGYEASLKGREIPSCELETFLSFYLFSIVAIIHVYISFIPSVKSFYMFICLNWFSFSVRDINIKRKSFYHVPTSCFISFRDIL